MDGAGPNVFERIDQKLSSMGIQIDNSDLHAAEKQVEANLEKNPADMESKLVRLELKVVEMARYLDAAIGALEHGAAAAPAQTSIEAFEQAPTEQRQAPAQQRQAPRKIKKLMQNPATGVIEEVEIEDNPADHFIVADGRGRYTGNVPQGGDAPQHKKSVFIAATDDEPVGKSEGKKR